MNPEEHELPWLIPSDAMPAKWKCVGTAQLVHQHRQGWLGAWDAFRAALFRDERVVVPIKTELWVWVHCDHPIDDAMTIVSPVGDIHTGYGASYATYVNGSVVERDRINRGGGK